MTGGPIVDLCPEGGPRLIARQVRTHGISAVRISVGVGYRDDPPGLPGLAHLVEHLALEPLGDGVGHIGFVERLGGSTGAQTLEDTTEFSTVIPTRHLAVTVEREFARLAGPAAPEAAIGRAGAVVVCELRSNLSMRPGRFFPWTELPAAMYTDFAHGHNGYGDEEAVRRATPEACAELLRVGYGARGLVVSVCSDLPPDEVMDLLVGAAAGLAPGNVPAREEPRPRALDRDSPVPPGSVAAVGFECPPPDIDWEDLRLLSGVFSRTLADSRPDAGDGLRVLSSRYSYFDSPPASGPDVFWLTVGVDAPTDAGTVADRCRDLVGRVASAVTPECVAREGTALRTARAIATSDPLEAARTLSVRARLGAPPTTEARAAVGVESARSTLADLLEARRGVTSMAVAS